MLSKAQLKKLGPLGPLFGTILDFRMMVMIIPALLFLFRDPRDLPTVNTFLFYLAIAIVVAGVTHVLRKIYFPYIDLEEVYKSTDGNPMARALIFLSVSLVICTCMFMLSMWSRG